MSTSTLDLLELDAIEEIGVECDYKDGNEGKWMVFYIDRFNCCGATLVCNDHHSNILQRWNDLVNEFYCMRCKNTLLAIIPIRYGSIISKIEPL